VLFRIHEGYSSTARRVPVMSSAASMRRTNLYDEYKTAQRGIKGINPSELAAMLKRARNSRLG